jgi:hypothetical protein
MLGMITASSFVRSIRILVLRHYPAATGTGLASTDFLMHHTLQHPMTRFLLEVNPHDPYFQWILIAGAVITLFYAVFLPAMKKKKKDPLARTASMSSLSQQRNVERQMQTLLVELSEMTRQISAQLDTRTQKLMMLIQDADERIDELKKLQNKTHAIASASPVPFAEQKPWPALSESVPRNIPIPDPVDDQHRPIYSLADQGRSASDIARELNRPRGEVELILALRGNDER